MIIHQQMVQQIRELLQGGRIERTPHIEDLAEQYAECCTGINERLARSTAFLDKGMRSEAVHEAESKPALFELIETVVFAELDTWRHVCADCKLPLPPALHMDIVERLRREIDKEKALAPLLKEYRSLVYQGDRDGCIRLLRAIRAADAENPVWAENLRPLEEAQMPDMANAVRAALAADDIERLKELHAELTHPQRAVPPPKAMMARVEDVISSELRAEAHARGEKLAADLEDALAAQNSAKIGQFLEDWASIEAVKTFEPTTVMADVLRRAREWHQRHCQAQEKEKSFASAVAAMRDSLQARNTPTETLIDQWEALRRLDGRIPADLQRAMNEALARATRRKKRRMHLAFAAVAAGIALLAAAIFVVAYRGRVERRHARIIAELRAWEQQERFADIGERLDRLEVEDSGFFDLPEARALRASAERGRREQDTRRLRFDAAMDSLRRVRENGFRLPTEQIQALIEEARGLAPDAAAEQLVKDWQVAWELRQAQRIDQANTSLRELIALLRRGVQERTTRTFQTEAAEKAAITDLQEIRHRAQDLLPDASAAVAEPVPALVAQLDAWEKELAERQRARTEAASLHETITQRLRTATPDLKLYGETLKQFVEAFPNDRNTSAYRRAINLLVHYTKATALQSFALPALPPPAGALQTLKTGLAEGGELHGGIWETDAATVVARADAATALRGKLPLLPLGHTDMFSLQVLEYRPRDQEQWQVLYSPEPFRSREEKDDNDNAYTVYWGDVYRFSREEIKPWLEHTSRIFAGNLDTRTFEVRLQRRAQDNIVPHGRFLLRFLADAMETPQPEVYVLRGIEALLQNEDLELIPKAWMIKRLVHLLHESFARFIPETAELVRLANRMETDVPWINKVHPTVRAAQEGIRETLGQFPPIAPIIDAHRRRGNVLAAALDRSVRCAGSMQPSASGTLEPVVTLTGGDRLWILNAPSPAAQAHFKIAFVRNTQGDMVPVAPVQADLFAGQVLFAPSDQRTERGILNAAGFAEHERPTMWPASWPLNAR